MMQLPNEVALSTESKFCVSFSNRRGIYFSRHCVLVRGLSGINPFENNSVTYSHFPNTDLRYNNGILVSKSRLGTVLFMPYFKYVVVLTVTNIKL